MDPLFFFSRSPFWALLGVDHKGSLDHIPLMGHPFNGSAVDPPLASALRRGAVAPKGRASMAAPYRGRRHGSFLPQGPHSALKGVDTPLGLDHPTKGRTVDPPLH